MANLFIHAESKESLQHQFQWVLDNLLQLLDPFSTNSTVNDAVVEAGGDNDLVIPFNGGSLFSLNGDSNLAGGTNGKDSGLRGVDDGGESLNGGVHAQVADGESTTLVLLGLELVVAGALTKVLDGVGNAGETKVVSVLNNRGDETGGSGNSDADVDVVVLADNSLAVLLSPAGVDSWDLAEGDRASLDEEVVDRKLVLAIGRGIEGLTKLEELANGQCGGNEVVRVLLGRLLQPSGNGLAHGGQRNIFERRTGGGGGSGGLVLLNIFLGDLSTTSSALESLDRNTLLESESLSGRADLGFAIKSGL